MPTQVGALKGQLRTVGSGQYWESEAVLSLQLTCLEWTSLSLSIQHLPPSVVSMLQPLPSCRLFSHGVKSKVPTLACMTLHDLPQNSLLLEPQFSALSPSNCLLQSCSRSSHSLFLPLGTDRWCGPPQADRVQSLTHLRALVGWHLTSEVFPALNGPEKIATLLKHSLSTFPFYYFSKALTAIQYIIYIFIYYISPSRI